MPALQPLKSEPTWVQWVTGLFLMLAALGLVGAGYGATRGYLLYVSCAWDATAGMPYL